MRWTAIATLMAACGLSMAASFRGRQEETIVLNRPTDPRVEEAAWERIRKGHANDKQRFVKLLAQLDERRIDGALDSPSVILSKRREIKAVLDEHARATMRDMAPEQLMVLNPIQLRNDVSPRLTGRMVKVGEGGEFPNLRLAAPHIKPGDTIQLGKGKFGFGGEMRPIALGLTDVAITGAGVDSTTLQIPAREVMLSKPWRRVRIENVKVDCHDSPCIDLRGGSMHVRKCEIFNYNSGAGGSNAVFAINSVLLFEECRFEGATGRAGDSHEGSAFDLRGDNLLFARNCTFVKNREVVRALFPCAFDGCSSEDAGAMAGHGILFYPEGRVFVRRNKVSLHRPEEAVEFARASDDPEFVDYVCGLGSGTDPESVKLAEKLQITRNLPYWIGLIRHERPEVRAKAAARVEALTGRKAFESAGTVPMSPAELDKTILELSNEEIQVREAATEKLLKGGESIRDRLRETVEKGLGEAKARAQRVLDRLDHERQWRSEIAFNAQITWFEENRARLKWDEKTARYVTGE